MDRQQQIRVHLKRVVNIPPDNGIFGSCGCDPYIVMEVHGLIKTPRSFRSKVVPFTLNPIWTDHVYVLTMTEEERERCYLHVSLYDRNDILDDELVGDVHIHLGQLGNNLHQCLESYPLHISRKRRDKPWTCQLELAFDIITHSREKEIIDIEVWENQRFSIFRQEWSRDFLHQTDPLPWISIDGIGGFHIADVSHSIPSGFESCIGWLYDIRLGDNNGWNYARSFSGPWYSEDSPMMKVRQRLWRNTCTKKKADIS